MLDFKLPPSLDLGNPTSDVRSLRVVEELTEQLCGISPEHRQSEKAVARPFHLTVVCPDPQNPVRVGKRSEPGLCCGCSFLALFKHWEMESAFRTFCR